jgi:hypothetical protein
MLARWRRRRSDPLDPGRRRTPVPGSGLQVCPACRAPFVHPVTRSRLDALRWSLLLRCGECRHERDLVVADDVATRFDEDLRGAARAIAQAIAEADRTRLEREADAFAAALDRDLIDAADFACRAASPAPGDPGSPPQTRRLPPGPRRPHGDQ